MDGICPFTEWIGDAIVPWDPVSGGGAYTKGESENKVGFCDHTAGGFYRTLRDAGFWNGRRVTVHFGEGRAGEACQIVNIFDRAWGQGRDSLGGSVGPTSPGIAWPPFTAMGKRNPNEYLISTEHEDAITVAGETKFVPGSEWTSEMFETDLRIKRWCVQEYRRVKGVDLLRFGYDSLAGHHMFDPRSRSECPGRFWRDDYHQRLWAALGGDDMFVAASVIGNGIEVPNLVSGLNEINLREVLGLSDQSNDWLIECSTFGDVIVYHGDRVRAGRARGPDHPIRVRLDNQGTCFFEVGMDTKVWVATRGYYV